MENNPEQPINQPSPLPQQPISPIPQPKSKFKILLLIIILLLIVGGGVYLLGTNKNIFISKYFQKPTPTLIPVSPTPTPDPTASWKTYKNKEYGFEFQYPANFFYQKNNGGTQGYNNVILAEFKAIDEKKLSLLLNETTFSVDYLKTYASTGSENISPESRAIGKNTFYYYGSGGGGVCYPDQYFINLNKEILIFNFAGCNDDKTLSEEYKKIENQILSTLKFTNQNQATDTSDWKTYINQELGASFKYPKEWGELKQREELCSGSNGSMREFNGQPCVHISLSAPIVGAESFLAVQSSLFAKYSPGRGAYWGDRFTMSVVTKNTTAEKFINNYCVDNKLYSCVKKTNPSGILYVKSQNAEVEANEMWPGGRDEAFYYSILSQNKNFPVILLSNSGILNLEDSEKILDQILSTFKFTD